MPTKDLEEVGILRYAVHDVKRAAKDEEDPDALDLEFVISDDSVDRHNDRVLQKGIDLTNFKKNPVVLFAHNSWAPPIARAISTKREKMEDKSHRHVSIARFMPADLNPSSYMIYQMCEKGFLKAASVGLRVKKHRRVEDDETRPYGYDFEECDLLEWSVVPIPANPNA